LYNLIYSGSTKKVPLSDKVGYGAGNFSTGVAIQVMGTYLVFYCTAILNLPGSLVGTAVSLSVIWDAITDPLMGYISDVTKSKLFGRRHLYILTGGLGIAVSNLLLWNIRVGMPTYIKFIIIFIVIILTKTFITVFVTPYTALGAELSNDYNERTSIQGIKTIFFLLGLAFVSVFGLYVFFKPTEEFPVGQLNPNSYANMGIFSSVIIILFALICFFCTKKYIPYLNRYRVKSEGRAKLSILLASFSRLLRNKSYLPIALAYMFNNIASALITNTGLHVFTYTFQLDSQQIALIVGFQFFFSILSQPIWMLTAKKIDKKPAMMLGLIISIAGSALFILLVFLKEYVKGGIVYFLPFAALAGFGTGGLFTLPLSMVADVIDKDELNTGLRSEGVYYGTLTLFYKLSQSITLFLLGFILDIVRFDASLPVQSEGTVISLGFVLGIGSALSFLLAFATLRNYDLNRNKIELIQQQIAERTFPH
jgi:glycoside/pentoside/hexuronide:cation symporter, GPH family